MPAPQPGFDPFQQHAWVPFETGGITAVEQREAPLLMYALDLADPDLAGNLARRYEKKGLHPTDLRFGVWADAKPQPVRTDEEIEEFGGPAIHLNFFGYRQLRYDEATPPERAALDALALVTELHVRKVIAPRFGVAVLRFNEGVPTMHGHVVAREKYDDGLQWPKSEDRQLVDLAGRRAMAERVRFDLVPGRREKIEAYLTATLQDCFVRSDEIDNPL